MAEVIILAPHSRKSGKYYAQKTFVTNYDKVIAMLVVRNAPRYTNGIIKASAMNAIHAKET